MTASFNNQNLENLSPSFLSFLMESGINELSRSFFAFIDPENFFQGKMLYFLEENNLHVYQSQFSLPSLHSLEQAYQDKKINLENPTVSDYQKCLDENRVLRFSSNEKETSSPYIRERFDWWGMEECFLIPLKKQNSWALGVLVLLNFQHSPAGENRLVQVQKNISFFYPLLSNRYELEFLSNEKESILRTKQRYRNLLSLFSRINQLMEEKQIFQIFLDEMIRIFGFDVAYIMQREGDSFFIDTASARLPEYDAIHQRMRSYFNLPQNRPSIDEKEGPDMALTMAAANKMPLYFYDIQTFKDAPMKEKDKKAIEVMQVPIRTVVHIPILYQDQAVGILDLFSYEDNLVSLTDNELEMITNLCTFIPSILYNSQLHLQLEKQKKEVDDKNRLIKAKNRQLMDELKLARQIQENLIPKNPPSIPGISLDSFYKPMEDVGGDFFDFIQIREPNLLGIFISDVSGHGVPAALITSMLKTLIETAGEERLSPAALLGYINQKILNQTNSNFLTAFYGIFNIEKSTLTYARASHNYPILMRENRLIELTSRGKMLGVLSDLEFEEKTVQLEKGDKILFYTDGLTEAINPEGKEFGDILPEILLSHKDKPLALFLNSLYYHLLHFREDYLFEDDVCVVGMEIH